MVKIERTREPYDEKYLLIDRDKLGTHPDATTNSGDT